MAKRSFGVCFISCLRPNTAWLLEICTLFLHFDILRCCILSWLVFLLISFRLSFIICVIFKVDFTQFLPTRPPPTFTLNKETSCRYFIDLWLEAILILSSCCFLVNGSFLSQFILVFLMKLLWSLPVLFYSWLSLIVAEPELSLVQPRLFCASTEWGGGGAQRHRPMPWVVKLIKIL